MTAYLTSALLGIAIAGGILLLVRRDHLHGSFAVWWLTVAAAALAVGLFPATVDWLGALFGVKYPPMLIVLVGIAALLLKLLTLDLDVTRRERRVRRLLQKVAILEAEMRDMRADLERQQQALQPPRQSANPAPIVQAPVVPVLPQEPRRSASA